MYTITASRKALSYSTAASRNWLFFAGTCDEIHSGNAKADYSIGRSDISFNYFGVCEKD